MTHFETTTITEARCPGCHKPILVGQFEGLPARVDTKPLADRQAEIAALLDGRWTYVLTKYRQLWHRDADRIRSNTIDGPIHAEHRCDERAIQLTLFDGKAK